jgi:DNA-binding transcriptional LysR family regulator
MKISHLGISAFLKTAQLGQMTAAAQSLGLSQSALSQRIALLEAELECALFVRDPSGLKLTEAGERLLRYAQSQERLEEELLSELRGANTELAGVLRLAGFSSVIRSVLIPALAPWLREHPQVMVDFRSYEVIDLPQVLQQGQADLVVMDYEWPKSGLVCEKLGDEEYVIIESKRFKGPADVYLDHGPHDNATESFFASQGKKNALYRRSFMGDTYGIIDGVAQGLGRAVMSKHLIRERSDVRVVTGAKRHVRPVTLHYYERPFYPRVQTAVVQELVKKSARFLG